MPRSRHSRRERLERQQRRVDTGQAAAQPPPHREPRSVSYTGIAGASLGILIFAGVTVAVLLDPGSNTRLWAVPFAAMALAFLPALVVSMTGGPRREVVLRATTGFCLVAAILGSLPLGFGFALLMAPPLALIASAAGLIFQGGRSSG
jgi:hypothetical protein